MQIEVWSLSLLGYLMQSPSMLGAVEAVTELTGRQKVLPAWSQEVSVSFAVVSFFFKIFIAFFFLKTHKRVRAAL